MLVRTRPLEPRVCQAGRGLAGNCISNTAAEPFGDKNSPRMSEVRGPGAAGLNRGKTG
jgi:hypothetical protein